MAFITIESSNYNGQTTDITFYPFTGGTINLGTQVIPYTRETENYEGTYDISIPFYGSSCALQIGASPCVDITGSTGYDGMYEYLGEGYLSYSSKFPDDWTIVCDANDPKSQALYFYRFDNGIQTTSWFMGNVYESFGGTQQLKIVKFTNYNVGISPCNTSFNWPVTDLAIPIYNNELPVEGTYTNTGSAGGTYTLVNNPTCDPGLDTDAAAYLAEVELSGGTIDATITSAVDTLFKDLKSNGFYNNIYFYPMVGGVAAAHGIEATLSSYRIDWYGGWTHNISGSTGNGTNTYGEIVGLGKASMPGGYGDSSYGVEIFKRYSITQGYDLQSNFTDKDVIISNFFTYNTAYIRRDSGFKTGSNTNSDGLYVSTQIGTTSGTGKLIRNGSTILINTAQADSSYGGNSWLGKGGGGSGVSTNNGYSFLFYSNYLTDAQVSTLSTIINTFQTTLGRNTY